MENEKGIEKVEDSKKGLTDQDKLSFIISFVCVLHITLIILSFVKRFPAPVPCSSIYWYFPPFSFFIINFVLFIKEKKNKKLNIITSIFFAFSSLILILAFIFPTTFEKLENALKNYGIIYYITGYFMMFSILVFHPVMEIITFSKNIKKLKSIKILTRLFLFSFIIPIITIIFLSIPYKYQSDKYHSILFTYEINTYGIPATDGDGTIYYHYTTYSNLTNKVIETREWIQN